MENIVKTKITSKDGTKLTKIETTLFGETVIEYCSKYNNTRKSETVYHNPDGPALIKETFKVYFLNGKPHRVDGPAVEWNSLNNSSPKNEYWFNGIEYSKEEFANLDKTVPEIVVNEVVEEVKKVKKTSTKSNKTKNVVEKEVEEISVSSYVNPNGIADESYDFVNDEPEVEVEVSRKSKIDLI